MNASFLAFAGLQTLVHAPVWILLLLKITAILLFAWSGYFLLKRTNPRWRILLWRVTASGLIVLLVATWMFPTLKIRVLQPPVIEEVATAPDNPAYEGDQETPAFAQENRQRTEHADAMHDGPIGFPGQWPDALAGYPSGMRERNALPIDTNVQYPASGADTQVSTAAEAESSAVVPFPSATPESVAASSTPWLWLLSAVWFVGLTLLVFRLILGHTRILRLVRRAKPATPWVCEESLRVAETLGCRRSVEVLQSSEVVSPFLFGTRRPRLLLPTRMTETSYRSDLPGILAHELTHVRHNDISWNVGLQLLSIVLWFHPLVWRVRKAHLAACELVSDAASATFVGDVTNYCRILARVAVDACGPLPSTGIAMARTSAIIHRLNVLRKHVFHNPLRRRSVVTFGLVTLLGITLLGVLQLAFAEPKEENESDTFASSTEVDRLGPFAVKLPNDGPTIEVLGVCDHFPNDEENKKYKNKRWWKPDGTPLEKPLYTLADLDGRCRSYPSEKEVAREVVYRLSDSMNENTDTWMSLSVKNVAGSAGGGNSRILQIMSASMDKTQKTFTVRLEYAQGEWTKNHSLPPGGSARVSGPSVGDTTLVFAPASELDGSAVLTLTHEMLDRQVRILAIDHEGKPHKSGRSSGMGVDDKHNMLTATFIDLPLSKVKEFRVESRPTQWVEWRNISVNPDEKTRTETPTPEGSLGAELSGSSNEVATSPTSDESGSSVPFAIELPNGTTYEVLGVCEHPSVGKKWWKPDGSPLEKPLYDSTRFRGQVQPGENEVAREIAYRVIEGKEDDFWFSTSFRQVGSSAGSTTLEALDGSGNLESRAVAVGKMQPVCSFCVEFADGEWTTLHTTKDGGEAIGGVLNLILSPALESEGATVLTVTHEMRDPQVRVVAVDLDGKLHPSSFGGASSAGKHLNMFTAKFAGLPLAQVKEFRIQSRPKLKAEIRNISLHSGQKTRPEFFKTTGSQVKAVPSPSPTPVLPSEPAENPTEKISPAEEVAKEADAAEEKETMRVTVLDEEGKPLEGVEVHANIWPKVEGFDVNRKYYTDSQGVAIVKVPETPGMLRLFLSKKSYVPLFRGWEENWLKVGNRLPKEHIFTMQKGTTIGGVVKDEEGKPIGGVRVEVKYDGGDLWHSLADGEEVPVTDAEGRWTLDNVPKDETIPLSLRFKHPDYVSDAHLGSLQNDQGISLEALRAQKATLVMKRGTPITGTVTDPEGKPIANALVAQGADRYGSDYPTTRTDEKGQYRFASIASSSYSANTVLTVIAPGFAPTLRALDVQPEMKPVDFQLEKGNTLRVRVVDQENQPVEGAFMSTDTWRQHRTLCDLEITKLTDAEGRWTWNWAPEDAIQMRIFKEGYMSVNHIPLAAQDEEHVVTLYPALKISGMVVDDETQEPIPSFRVIHGRNLEGNSDNEIHWDSSWTDPFGKDGKYEITIGDPARVHAIRIEADGYLPAVSREFKDDEGNVTCDFALTKGKTMNVSVLLPDGKPAAGAEARLCREEHGNLHNMAMFIENGQFPSADSTRTKLQVDENGQLKIEPQGCEFLLVVIHDQGFANVTSEDLAANPQINLTAWARLEGTIHRNSKPAVHAKLYIDLVDSLDRKWFFLNFRSRITTDEDGNFVFPKLKPGKWRLLELSDEKKNISDSRRREEIVELKPRETFKLLIEAREVVGQIEWPEGKLPNGDLTKVSAMIYSKQPERPPIPQEVREQGPDAVRKWLQKWSESDAGQEYQAKLSSVRPQSVSIDQKGQLRIEDAVPGEYTLHVYYIPSNEKLLPWERLDLLRYKAVLSIPETPDDMNDKPLDLGKISLIDESPKEISFATLKQPEESTSGEKSVGSLRTQAELLRYMIFTYRENKAKIQTWQGKVVVESQVSYKSQQSGDSYTCHVDFVFDRKQQSIRWNNTLEKWSKIINGNDEPKAVPQIVNGMVTPEGFYQFGRQGTEPGDPLKRPLTLVIKPSDESQRIRLESQNYDFLPLLYLDTPHGDVARGIVTYLGWTDNPNLDAIKVIHDGDHVTVDMGTGDSYNRYTLSLSQGCNPISYESTGGNPGTSKWEYRWTYEQVDGVWLPKTWTETIHAENDRDEQRTVTFVEHQLNQPVESSAFSLSSLGIEKGDLIQDRRTQPMTRYHYEEE